MTRIKNTACLYIQVPDALGGTDCGSAELPDKFRVGEQEPLSRSIGLPSL